MKRTLSAVLAMVIPLVLTARSSEIVSAARQNNSAAARHSDVCGYRYQIWPVVQQGARYLTGVADGTIFDSYTSGMRETFIDDELTGIEVDFGYPKGSGKLDHAMAGVLGSLDDAIQAGSSDSSFGFYIQSARKAQAQAWKIVGSICSWKGKALTKTGYLYTYKLGSHTTNVFYAPKAWELSWSFDCGDQSGNFIATIETAGGGYVKQAANLLNSGDASLTFVGHGGAFKVSVISECSWHLQATKQ